jgi:hypothetical protein
VCSTRCRWPIPGTEEVLQWSICTVLLGKIIIFSP